MYFSEKKPVVNVDNHRQVRWFRDTLDAMIETGRFYDYDGSIIMINEFDENKSVLRFTFLNTRVVMRSWLHQHITFVKTEIDRVEETTYLVECSAPSSLASELARPHTPRDGMRELNISRAVINEWYRKYKTSHVTFNPSYIWRYEELENGDIVLTERVYENNIVEAA